MQEHFQSYRDNTPVLPRINDSESGMTRIRHLMTQYLTLTNLGSFERYKLAHEINLEKRALNLPDVFPPGYNIFYSPGSNAGQFSHLDLSHLEFVIEPSVTSDERLFGDGVFKSLEITNSNLEGTVFKGMRCYSLYLNNSNLRGCKLNFNFYDLMVLTGANVEGL